MGKLPLLPGAQTPRGDQVCFSQNGTEPKVVFENLASGKTIWLGMVGDLSDPYAYEKITVEAKQAQGCNVCYTMLSSYENDVTHAMYDLQIVTRRDRNSGGFTAEVFEKKQQRSLVQLVFQLGLSKLETVNP